MGAQRILIVGGRAARGRDLEAELVRLGHRPCVVASPLEAIDRLVEDAGRTFRTVYVAESLGSATGAQFVRFLIEEFPDVRPVLLEEPASPRRDIREPDAPIAASALGGQP